MLANSTLPPNPPRPEELTGLAQMARSVVGLSIDDQKVDFLAGRLQGRLAANGLTSYTDYYQLLQESEAERAAFGEALTTHTTSFFREKYQYDWLLETGLPELARTGPSRGREIVIWSAACSTGQEGYSALMTAHQVRDQGHWGLSPSLIGTDVSRPVIRKAATAVYTGSELDGIPMDLRRRFLLSSKSGGDVYRIGPELRTRARWRLANLVTAQGLDGIAADVVFLRNVLIYFDAEVRRRVVENVFRRLRPGGYLLCGHTEAPQARREGLVQIKPSIFRKEEA